MSQLSMPLAEKLDMPLAELCNSSELADSARIPVLLKCDPDELHNVAVDIANGGGRVRHLFFNVGVAAAWVPLFFLSELVANESILAIELEQDFTVA